MRRTACSCGRSSAATTMMTCQCLRPCSWRKVRYIELNPAPRFRTAVWPAAPETARVKAPPPAHKNRPETATTAAPAVRARDTATGRPSASEAAANTHRKPAVLERKWGLSLSCVRPPALCATRKRGVDSDWIWLCDWLMAGWCHNTRCYGSWTGERDWDLEECKYETHNLPLPSRSRFLLDFIAHYQVKSGPKHLRTFKIWLCWKVFRFCISTHLFTMHIKIHQFCSKWSRALDKSVYFARWNTMLVVCHKSVTLCVVFRSGRRADNWLTRMQLVISSCCSPALEICTCTIMHRDVIVTKYTFICSTKPCFTLKRLLHWTLSIITLQNSFSRSVFCLFSGK